MGSILGDTANSVTCDTTRLRWIKHVVSSFGLGVDGSFWIDTVGSGKFGIFAIASMYWVFESLLRKSQMYLSIRFWTAALGLES